MKQQQKCCPVLYTNCPIYAIKPSGVGNVFSNVTLHGGAQRDGSLLQGAQHEPSLC